MTYDENKLALIRISRSKLHKVISLVVPLYTTDADYLCSGRSLMTGGSKIGSKNYSFNPGYDKFKFPLLEMEL